MKAKKGFVTASWQDVTMTRHSSGIIDSLSKDKTHKILNNG